MGALCTKPDSCSVLQPIVVDRSSIIRSHTVNYEALGDWHMWSQLDLRDEAEKLRLAVFMNDLLKVIVAEEGLRLSELPLKGDIDLEQIHFHDTFHFRWPMNEENVTHMVKEFTKNADGMHIPLPKETLCKLIEYGTNYYKTQPNIICLTIPEHVKLTVVGDLHGQLQDLLYILDTNGAPSPTNWYLFNGDFVDRGYCSIEISAIIFAYKSLFPDAVHINRGNHEDQNVNRLYGFQREVSRKYDNSVYLMFNDLFDQLPLGFVINQTILVIHGGLFNTDNVTLNQLNEIPRQKFTPNVNSEELVEGLTSENEKEKLRHQIRLMRELLWSDPTPQNGRQVSTRGVGLFFGPDICNAFLDDNKLSLIIRSHEAVKSGYQWSYSSDQPLKGKISPQTGNLEEFKFQLLTIFSCSNYGNSHNQGAIIVLDSELNYTIQNYQIPSMKLNPYFAPSFRSIEDENRHNIIELIITKKIPLKTAFEKADIMKKEVVTVEDWGKTLNEVLELNFDWSKLVNLFAKVDAKGDIKYEEFLNSYLTTYQSSKNTNCVFDTIYANRRELETIFCFFDPEGTGTITLTAFKTGVNLLNNNLPDNAKWHNIEYLFRELDIEGNSVININEFMEAFRIIDAHRRSSSTNLVMDIAQIHNAPEPKQVVPPTSRTSGPHPRLHNENSPTSGILLQSIL